MHSFNELEKIYHQALSHAKTLPELEIGEETIIVSTTRAIPAAKTLFTGILHSGKTAIFSMPTEAMYHLIPYRETGNLIVYYMEPRSLRIVGIAESAGLLGLETTFIGPRMHPAVRERVEQQGAQIIEVTNQYPLLTMSIYSLLRVPRLLGARDERFRAEIDELDSALAWVNEWIQPIFNKIDAEGNRLNLQIFYTPITEPGAYYYYNITGVYPRPLDTLDPAREKGLVMISSVEELTYKDILVQYSMRYGTASVVRIDTDPVTASLYSILATIMLTGKIV